MWRIRQFFAFLKDEKGIGVVEVILILVGILTPYYRVSIRCIG